MGSGATSGRRPSQRVRQRYSAPPSTAARTKRRPSKEDDGKKELRQLLAAANTAVQEQLRKEAALLAVRWVTFEGVLWPCFASWEAGLKARETEQAQLLGDMFRAAAALHDTTHLGLALAKAARFDMPIGSKQLQTALDQLLAQEEREGLLQCLSTSLADADSLSVMVWLEEADAKGLEVPREVKQWSAAAVTDTATVHTPKGWEAWDFLDAFAELNAERLEPSGPTAVDPELAGLLGFGGSALKSELFDVRRAARAAAAQRQQQEDDGLFRRWAYDQPLYEREGSRPSQAPTERCQELPERWRQDQDPRPSARWSGARVQAPGTFEAPKYPRTAASASSPPTASCPNAGYSAAQAGRSAFGARQEASSGGRAASAGPHSAPPRGQEASNKPRRSSVPPPRGQGNPSTSSQPPPRQHPVTDARVKAMQCLGLAPGAALTSEELRQAYKKAALRWHPDRQQNHGNVEEATRRFQEARAAFELLQRSLS